MKTLVSMLLAGILGCNASCSKSQPTESSSPAPIAKEGIAPRPAGPVTGSDAAPQDTTAIVESSNAFALSLYEKLANRPGNLFFSPSSIHTVLALTYAGAAGETARQMKDVLRLKLPEETLHGAYANLLRQLNPPGRDPGAQPAFELLSANALWGQKAYPFSPDYLNLAETRYAAALRALDFEKSLDASNAINTWAAERTRNKIKQIVSPGNFTKDTRLLLTNAVYFKSGWKMPFSEQETKKQTFHVTLDKAYPVPLMHQKGIFGYSETNTLQVLELPYVQKELSLLVLLPKMPIDLSDTADVLRMPENVLQLLKGIESAQVDVTLPKFSFASERQLKATLSALGMTEAFDVQKADFSKMTTLKKAPESPVALLFIQEVLHQAHIAVDENGTEAAAVTAVLTLEGGGAQPGAPKVFRADHPFLFIIRHNPSGAILFIGRVVNPVSS